MNRQCWALFFTLLALNLLIYTPAFHSSDGQAMFATAESLARRGAWDIEQIRWMGLQQGTYGLDGLLYSRKGLGQPLLALPLTWTGLLVPGWGPVSTTLLFGALLAALTGVLLHHLTVLLGYQPKVGLLVGLAYGSATMAWPYAKTFFSDPLAGSLLLVAMIALAHYRRHPSPWAAFSLGLALAWAVATRYAEALFLPIFGLLLLAVVAEQKSWWRQKPRLSWLATLLQTPGIWAFLAPVAAVGLFLLGFNFYRYGNPLNTGYLPQETFSAIWWQGILGQLLSPGRGFLLHNPLLWLSLPGLVLLWRRDRLITLAALSVILVHLLLYGKWFMWHGGFAWGARFMVATLPGWALALAPIINWLFDPATGRRMLQLGFAGLWAFSTVMQLPGWLVDFDLWQDRLLATNLPMFAPETFFGWQYSPLLQTWPLINLNTLNVVWVQQGAIVWWLLALLLVNLALALWTLWRNGPPLPTALLGLLTIVLLLIHSHRSQPIDLQTAFETINRLDAALLYHHPPDAAAIAELTTTQQPTLGLFGFDEAALNTFAAAHDTLWWVGQAQPDIERYLLQSHTPADRQSFGSQQATLWHRPQPDLQPRNAILGTRIQLQQWGLHQQERGRLLGIELHWQTTTPLTETYHVFLHLIAADGTRVAQRDGQPVNWQRPTTTWQAGETIIDPHAFWLPDLPPGPYELRLGLYQPESGQRLLLPDGQDTLDLTTIVVP